jgi:hypothetical protein
MRTVIHGVFSMALVACASSAAPAPERKPEPKTVVEVTQAPTPPSAFEQRWSSACGEGGAVGQCPSPFDRPALFVEVDGTGEQAAPPFCGAIEAPDQDAARAALLGKSKPLKACFRGMPPGAWVELTGKGEPLAADAQTSAERSPKAEACVAKIVKRALEGAGSAAPAERIVVMRSAAAKTGDEVLTKDSLDAVIAQRGGEVSTCYDAALEVWPGLSGRIATSLVIWFDGRVALVRTGESTLENTSLECCINTAVRSWTFPKPADGSIALVSFPFALGGATR